MRIGLIARGERRGLGYLTRDFAANMRPDKVLLIRPQAAIDVGLHQFPEWFDAERTTLLTWNGFFLDEHACRKWLTDLDVVYFAETPYSWDFCDWARDAGIRTVCHAMPEYWPFHAHPERSRPDFVWAPTPWRLDHLPKGAEVVPVPVDLAQFAPRPEHESGPIRWLHVVGARAAADRNGTRVFFDALKLLKQEHHVIIRSQMDTSYPQGRVGRHVHIENHATEVEHRAQLYADADALVLPRRYGGLSLPAQEAMGAGLALVMPDVEPQASTWPIIPIAAPFENFITTSAGSIPICAPDPKDLARTLDWMGQHRGALAVEQQRSRAWAEANSWERLEPVVREALERACA